jgi:hypothetical protein
MTTAAILLLIYILPAFIAERRKHQHKTPILILNLFLGWTLIGWVAALVWAAMPVIPQQPEIYIRAENQEHLGTVYDSLDPMDKQIVRDRLRKSGRVS